MNRKQAPATPNPFDRCVEKVWFEDFGDRCWLRWIDIQGRHGIYVPLPVKMIKEAEVV